MGASEKHNITKDSFKQKLSIAYMVTHFPIETFIVREIKKLIKSNINVKIFAVKAPTAKQFEKSLTDSFDLGELCSYARPDNTLNHFLINVKSLLSHPWRYLQVLKLFLWQALRIVPGEFFRIIYHFYCGIGFSEKIRKLGITHIHAHFPAGTNMALAASRYLGVSFSFTVHASADIFMNPIMLSEKVTHASFIVAVCDYSKKYLDSVTDYKYSDKIFRVYNGIDISEPDRFSVICSNAKKGLPNAKEQIRIISIGRLLRVKGFGTLIAACKILKEKGYNFSCDIIGPGPEAHGFDQEIFEKLIGQLELTESVFLAGMLSLPDIYQALANADIFVLLSEIEINGYRDGFPTVILEAMLMSLPVVSTWISGIPEMVLPGKTGFLVHERDPDRAAEAMETLINNESMRREFGKAGRERLIQNFDLEISGESLVHLFNRFCHQCSNNVKSP
jgi:colanic acid/amylovoran biosynthesis glycosyltransferase